MSALHLPFGRLLTVVALAATAVAQTPRPPLPPAGPESPRPLPRLQPPLGAPLAGLTAAERDRFDRGGQFYAGGAPSGSGPNLNQFACGICHNNPVGGVGQTKVLHFGQEVGGVFDPLESLGGSLLQVTSVGGCPEFVPAQANVTFFRGTPGAMGYGLVEAIDDADLAALEAAPPSPLVSGRVHWVLPLEAPPNAPLRAGRFGWKSIHATLLSFSGDAARNEQGVTNRLAPTEPAPNGDTAILPSCDFDPDPEDGPHLGDGIDFIDRLTDFQRLMAAPPQTPRTGMAGEALFHSVGCADCHVPAFQTRADLALEAAIRDLPIRPYSDFLLHDMGQLADFPEGAAGASEFRTTPLWGLRRRFFLLHDGRVSAGTLEARVSEAVMWHGTASSEAATSASMYAALSAPDRALLIAFLDSLGRREFDFDGDSDVDADDAQAFWGCYGGGPYGPDDPCAVMDLDGDGDVDDRDHEGLRAALRL